MLSDTATANNRESGMWVDVVAGWGLDIGAHSTAINQTRQSDGADTWAAEADTQLELYPTQLGLFY